MVGSGGFSRVDVTLTEDALDGDCTCPATLAAPVAAATLSSPGDKAQARRLVREHNAAFAAYRDVAHAAGNVALALAAGPELRRMLDRYALRLTTVVVWA